MLNTETTFLCELSDTELDAVAAAGHTSIRVGNIAFDNFALQIASNNQANVAFVNFASHQGGSQSNNNNAGNQNF